VTKHAEADSLLVAVKKGSESLTVLVAALVRYVADKNGKPSFLLKFLQVVFDEL